MRRCAARTSQGANTPGRSAPDACRDPQGENVAGYSLSPNDNARPSVAVAGSSTPGCLFRRSEPADMAPCRGSIIDRVGRWSGTRQGPVQCGERRRVSRERGSPSWPPCPRGVHPLSLLNDLSRPSTPSNPRSFGPSCRLRGCCQYRIHEARQMSLDRSVRKLRWMVELS